MEEHHAREDLRFIREMLEETRRTVADNGMHYINWSIMPALGIIGTYVVLITGIPSIYVLWIWGLAVGLGWVFSYLIGRRQTSDKRPSFADRVLVSVWVAAGIAMMIIAFGGMISGAFSPQVIPALMAVIMGVPFLTAGLLYDLNWFRLISVGWWIAGIAFFFWDSVHTLAALGVLLVLLQAAPGIYLYKTYRTRPVHP